MHVPCAVGFHENLKRSHDTARRPVLKMTLDIARTLNSTKVPSYSDMMVYLVGSPYEQNFMNNLVVVTNPSLNNAQGLDNAPLNNPPRSPAGSILISGLA